VGHTGARLGDDTREPGLETSPLAGVIESIFEAELPVLLGEVWLPAYYGDRSAFDVFLVRLVSRGASAP
jgi:hypothetical protein